MNKAQLIDAVAENEKVGDLAAAAIAVDVVLDAILREVVAGGRVSVTGFGAFTKVDRPARYARNPQTGERVRVKKTSVPHFRPGQGFKDLVAGSKKLPPHKLAVKKATKRIFVDGELVAPPKKRAAAKKAAPLKQITTRVITAKKAKTTTAKVAPPKKTAVRGTATEKATAKTAAKRTAKKTAAKKRTTAKRTSNEK